MRATLDSELGSCIAPPLLWKPPIRIAHGHIRPAPAAVSISRGRALFWQDEPQDRLIEILDGVVRIVRLLQNGNRQILSFYWPGDRLRPARPACLQFSAEAVTDCRVLRATDTGPCDQDAECCIQRVMADTLSLVLVMGQKTVTQRLAWFLLRIRSHLPRDPWRVHAFQILIPRADIADHLGTSIETVCRTLAEFKSRGLIDLPTRKTIRFVDLPGLVHLAGE